MFPIANKNNDRTLTASDSNLQRELPKVVQQALNKAKQSETKDAPEFMKDQKVKKQKSYVEPVTTAAQKKNSKIQNVSCFVFIRENLCVLLIYNMHLTNEIYLLLAMSISNEFVHN